MSQAGQMQLTFGRERQIYAVSELNAAVQRRFERDFKGIWVAGEISGCRAATSGHYYFSLKDAQSQVKCALFRGNARYIKFRPQDGLSVLARGNLEVYEARGEYQLIVELLEPQGAGALQLAFEQLKKKLTAEGLFEAGRKRALPAFPARIGIVTSPAGAAIRDILHVLERRFQGLHLRLYPAQVQGEGSIEQVCAGLAYFSMSGWADVVILTRGGGSIEDLWTFNEEMVARAIAASRVPVISAVGHETDFTIADFVADARAPTPSAAAEIVIRTRDSICEQINVWRERTAAAMRFKLLHCARDLQNRGAERASTIVHRLISRRVQQIDELDFRLRRVQSRILEERARKLSDLRRRLENCDVRLALARHKRRLESLHSRLTQNVQARLWKKRHDYEALRIHLTQLSPLAILARGYAIVQNADGKALRSTEETAPGESIDVRLHAGRLRATVDRTLY